MQEAARAESLTVSPLDAVAIRAAVTAARQRLGRAGLLRSCSLALTAGGPAWAAALLLLPWPGWAAGLAGAALLIGLGLGLLRWPAPHEAARRLDRLLSLEGRLVTSHELVLGGDRRPMVQLLLADTASRLQGRTLPAELARPLPWRAWLLAAAFLAATGALSAAGLGRHASRAGEAAAGSQGAAKPGGDPATPPAADTKPGPTATPQPPPGPAPPGDGATGSPAEAAARQPATAPGAPAGEQQRPGARDAASGSAARPDGAEDPAKDGSGGAGTASAADGADAAASPGSPGRPGRDGEDRLPGARAGSAALTIDRAGAAGKPQAGGLGPRGLVPGAALLVAPGAGLGGGPRSLPLRYTPVVERYLRAGEAAGGPGVADRTGGEGRADGND